MPRETIKVDTKGVIIPKVAAGKMPDGKADKMVNSSKQGDETVSIDITYNSKVNIKGYEQAIVDTVWKGKSSLHKTSDATGVGNTQAIGYIHQGKMLFLVSRLEQKKSIQIEKTGDVSGGKHQFG